MRAMVARGLKMGAALAASAAGAVMIASSLQGRSPWAGLNAMANSVGVGKRRRRARFDASVTPIGFAVLAGEMLACGLLFEAGATAVSSRKSPDGDDLDRVRGAPSPLEERVRRARIDDEAAAVQRPPSDS